jgi:hypothetical protein
MFGGQSPPSVTDAWTRLEWPVDTPCSDGVGLLLGAREARADGFEEGSVRLVARLR